MTRYLLIPLVIFALAVALLLYASKAFDEVMLAGNTDWWEGEG
jgi:uncharacterized membrane protein YqhA